MHNVTAVWPSLSGLYGVGLSWGLVPHNSESALRQSNIIGKHKKTCTHHQNELDTLKAWKLGSVMLVHTLTYLEACFPQGQVKAVHIWAGQGVDDRWWQDLCVCVPGSLQLCEQILPVRQSSRAEVHVCQTVHNSDKVRMRQTNQVVPFRIGAGTQPL